MSSHRDVIVVSYQIKTSLHHVARTCCSVIVIYMQIIVEVNEEKRWIRSILTQIVDNTAAAIAERATSTANIANGCRIRERLPKPTRDVGTVKVEHVRIPDAVCVVAVSGHANILVVIPPSFASCRLRWQYSLCSRLNSMWPAASEL